MKAGLLCLAALAAAQPQLHRRHNHRRAIVTIVDTDIVTATAPNVIVYVDSNGKPISTAYEDKPAPTYSAAAPPAYAPAAPAPYSAAAAPSYSPAAPSSAAAVPASSQPIAPAYSSVVVPSYSVVWTAPASSLAPASSSYIPTTLVQQPSSSSAAASSAPSSSSPPTSGDVSGYGLTYSPYHTDNTCKTQDEVTADFQDIFSKGDYGIVRLYGTDCNQVAMVLQATESKGTKVFAGIYDINNVDSEAQKIVSAVNGDWSRIDTVSVGNELVNSKQATVGQVSAAVSKAKGCLTGYSGPVVTVDTFIAIIENPGLCDVGDYVAANCHAFFDGHVAADGAGKFVLDQAQRVSSTCGGKKTVITESGWPSSGSANNVAVPSTANQQAAVASLKQAFSSNLFLFSAFNDYWKPNNAATFNAEQYWGILGDSASCQS